MKKLLVIIFTTILIVNIVGAQESKSGYAGGLHFGLKAGLNRSNVYDSKTQDFRNDPKMGFVGGVFASIPLSEFIGIQPEILYSQKGFKGSGITLGQAYNVTRTTNYIDVPIFLAIKPISFITILAGPQFSYLTSQKDDFDNTLFSSSQEQQFQNSNLRRNMLCFVGGLDFNLMSAAVISTRMGWDFQRNNGDGTSSVPNYKNVWLQLTLGFRL